MGLFNKNKCSSVKIEDDIALIKEATNKMEVIISIVQEDESTKKKLLALQEKIRYINPFSSSKAYDKDKKIIASIDDLKILLFKAANNNKEFTNPDIVAEIRGFELLIDERKALIA